MIDRNPWPPAPVLRGLKMAVIEHPLMFKVPAQTSRDTLRNKPTWFLVAEDGQGRVGVGECSLILGLSPESEAVARTMLHDIAAKGVLDAMDVPASCPAVRFAVETAAWDLAQGGSGNIATSPPSRLEKSNPPAGGAAVPVAFGVLDPKPIPGKLPVN